MPKEIERKYLIRGTSWKDKSGYTEPPKKIKQGYISTNGNTVRVRTISQERKNETIESAWLTLKTPSKGISRDEYEYEIPVKDAKEMLRNMCGNIIEKTRHMVKHVGHVWEVDVFSGKNKGLIVAEIELSSEKETFAYPTWITKEVSSEKKYTNANLSKKPFCYWKKQIKKVLD